MAVTQKLLDMDTYFISSTGSKVILNDLDHYSLTDVTNVNENIMTIYDKESFSTVPACDCDPDSGLGLQGRYNLGLTCGTCGSLCAEAKDKTDPYMWMKAIRPDIEFINPTFWLMFREILNKNIDYLRWMCDPRYNPPTPVPAYMLGIKELLGVRSYKVFITKIDSIIIYLINHGAFKDPGKQTDLKGLLEMYRAPNNGIFSTFMPIVNKKVFVMENTTMGKFTNLAVADVIDVVMLWIKTTSEDRITVNKAALVTATTISNLANMYKSYFDKYLLKKPGAIRKHIYGARSHFTFRSVISSIPGKHRYDEIHVPWAIGVSAFRPHILNKLCNQKGYTYKEASKLLFKSVKLYNKDIDIILQEMIAETQDKEGIPVLSTRNPSLLAGSSELMYITIFKTDVSDLTVSTSMLSIKAQNGDVDGDEINYAILLDRMMQDTFRPLEPYYNAVDLSKPYSVCGNLTLLSPANNILGSYLADNTEDVNNDTVIDKLL